jgi:hypothetical protein
MLMLKTRLRALTGPAIIFCLLLPLFSCKWPLQESEGQSEKTNGSNRERQDYTGLESKYFSAQHAVNNTIYTVSAVRLAENESCIVYGERDANISVSTAEAIAKKVKERIDPLMKEVFGDFRQNLKIRDFITSDKLVLFLLDIKDSYEPKKNPSYIAGYFHAKDLNSRQYSGDSNLMPMIYMDVNPGVPEEEDGEFFNTIAHELQHLINYSIRIARANSTDGNAPFQETWIDEGLASAAEYLYNGRHIQDKITYFKNDSGNAFALGNNFLTWDSEYIDYCTIYLFFQWLRIQADRVSGGSANPAYKGWEIYQDIINSDYRDYRAVTEAAKNHFNDAESGNWEILLSRWLLANHVNAPDGFLGYKNEIAAQVRTITGVSISLPPGGGVFSYLNGGFAPPLGLNIRYIGVDGSGNLIADLAGFGGTGRLLTFNANTQSLSLGNETSSAWAEKVRNVSETGYLTGMSGASSLDIPRTTEVPQGPYPIDIPPAFLAE